jgi:hypothetical protein
MRPNYDSLRGGETKQTLKGSFLPNYIKIANPTLLTHRNLRLSCHTELQLGRQMSSREGDWSLFLDPDQATLNLDILIIP